MKILLLGKAYFIDDLREMGHEVVSCSARDRGGVRFRTLPLPVEEVLSQLAPDFVPDAVVLGDESLHPMFSGMDRLEIPVAWVAVDSHLHVSWHQHYAAAFDVIDVAQQSYVDAYRVDPERQLVRWSPLFARSACIPPRSGERDLDVSFVGTLNRAVNPARSELIEGLARRIPLNVRVGDYVKVFSRSKIVLNQCLSDDVNFRTFEAMACGPLLLMERVGNGLFDLFEDGRHLVTYERGNVEEVVEKVQYFLAHEAERVAIADRGRDAVVAKHTSRHRAERLVKALGGPEAMDRVARRLAARESILASLVEAYEAAAHAYSDRGDPRIRAGFRMLARESSKLRAARVLRRFEGQ